MSRNVSLAHLSPAAQRQAAEQIGAAAARGRETPAPKRNKYGARRTEIDGITFASAAEARRYTELKALHRAGKIDGLALQPKFPVAINGTHCFTYIADFGYREDRRQVYEDVKGCDTALGKLKRRVVECAYPGVKIVIIKAGRA